MTGERAKNDVPAKHKHQKKNGMQNGKETRRTGDKRKS